MAVGDIVFLKDFQTSTATSAVILNTYYYKCMSDDSGGDCASLRETFIANVLPSILNVQGTYITHTTIETINLMNPDDYESWGLTSSNVGVAGGGNPMPDLCAMSILLSRSTRAIRNGHKRYAGLTEGDQDHGVISSTLMSALNTLAAQLLIDLPRASDLWRPILYGKPIPGKRADPIVSLINGATVSNKVSSQNSRKK